MATKVFMEALSPTMEEGRLVKWLKAEGDAVKNGDTLAEVETDKALMELVARGEGILRKRMIEDGATAPVGTVIGVIASADEDISGVAGADAAKPTEKPPESKAGPPPLVAKLRRRPNQSVINPVHPQPLQRSRSPNRLSPLLLPALVLVPHPWRAGSPQSVASTWAP
jgi:pyruvate/2-oxoglutarate dehydrogenase complex dihydrolipoamide acyltransferase (E2) component